VTKPSERRVLVIEDDRSISRLLQLKLEHRGMVVRCEKDGIAGLQAVKTFAPDIILLDILLPGMDGEHILFKLREEGNRTPVIMLTARDRPIDKVRNLDVGANDYLTKPFDIDELLARMRSVLRRIPATETMRVGDLALDRATRIVRRGERTIDLTAREFELVDLLMTNARRVLPRDVILDRIWGYDADVDPNVLDVYIGYLRKKIEVPDLPRLIHTIRGVGFTTRGIDWCRTSPISVSRAVHISRLPERTRSMRWLSIRWRLTIFYALTILAIAIVLIIAMFAFMGTGFERNLRDSVKDRAQEASLVLQREGTISPQAFTDLGRGGMQILLLDETGHVLEQANTSLRIGDTAPSNDWQGALISGSGSSRTANDETFAGGKPFYSYAIKVQAGGAPVRIVQVMEYYASSGLEHQQPFIFATALAGVMILAIILSAGGGFLLVRSSLSPVNALATAAGEITAGDLGRRLPVTSERDELGKLAVSFNALLSRLESAFADRERALQEQRRFAADASHELRTPLTSILGYTRMLRSWGMLDPEIARESTEALEREADRMRTLVDQLLRLARGDESAIVAAVRHREDIGVIVAESTDAARAIAAGNHDVRLDLPSEPIFGEVDRTLVRQSIGILLDNAMKYTPAGGTITVSLQHANEMATIEVADTGPGLATQHLSHLFERFYRVEEARPTHGAGLGLAIARQIAEQHGGSIGVESTVGSGSTFTIRLPLTTTIEAE